MKDEAAVPLHWDDLVFENRNKDYGAYLIRKVYSRNLVRSLIITLLVMALVFAYPSIIDFFKSRENTGPVNEVKQLTVNLDQPPPIIPNQPPPPKLDIPPPIKTIIKFLPPKVTDKQIVEEEMPTVEEIKTNDTGKQNTEGTGEVIFDEPVKEVGKEDIDPNQVFLVVEQPPEFPGGLQALYKFVYKTIRYPAQARRMGIEGTVYISFVVGANGEISEVQTMKGIGSGCDEEAKRVVQLLPPWKPGKQRGRPVKVRYTLPLKFKLG